MATAMLVARSGSLLLALVAGVVLQQSAPKAQMLFASEYFPNQISDTTGEVWLGLIPSATGWQLVSTTIRVQPVNAGCIENGHRVTVATPTHPLFLLRGVHLVPGPIDTASVAHVRLMPPATRTFEFGGRTYSLVARGSKRAYELRLARRTDGRSQELAAFHPRDTSTRIAWPPEVIWVGDLDHDGQPDVFADVHMLETPGDWILYLSSAAGPGQLVGKVAEFKGEQC